MTDHSINPRQITVLTILAYMYGAPADLVARMLGKSMPHTYRDIRNWREAKLISPLKIRPVPGPVWVFSTRSGVEGLTGLSTRYWTPTPKMAAHVRTVLEVRLALAGLDLERWISERELRSQVGPVKAGESRPHIHDGRFYTREGQFWAVEVELSPKTPAMARVAVAKAKQAAGKAGCDKVIYYCKNGEIRNLITASAVAVKGVEGPPVRVAMLAEVLDSSPFTGASAGSRPGLSLIEGGASDHFNQADNGRHPGEAVS
ncbi:hypothetical protein C5E51_16785 [Nocardia nova]|uniref:hypothetical protein n=1 Tax=Nocardia nova TaxID=37330 RepID=UPI000CEA167F|nr:hypothetical protein [Nocardia nova]PPJ07830.1 hypothetical protein C5E51_16785 [Nocardia nova]